MATAHVTLSLENARYATSVQARQHVLTFDEPADKGGADTAAKPSEHLIASLAACTAITLRMYVEHKGWDVRSITVDSTLEHEKLSGVSHTRIATTVHVDGDLTEEQRHRVMHIAKACPVHSILTGTLTIDTHLV
jgi:putative redox protein